MKTLEPRGRRAVAGLVLVVGLGAAWVAVEVGARSGDAGRPAPTAGRLATASLPATVAAPGDPFAERLPEEWRATCRGAPALDGAAAAALVCNPGAPVVRLEVRRYESAAGALDAYREVAPVPEAAADTGAATCAGGAPDERSWSMRDAPDHVVGRYACALTGGRASLWWVRGDAVTHAVGASGDLAALFTWWLATPEV